MLSPNALRSLDKLGIYERIHDKGFLLDPVSFRDEHENELNKFYFGSQKMYQYDALRINRETVVRELLAVVEEDSKRESTSYSTVNWSTLLFFR